MRFLVVFFFILIPLLSLSQDSYKSKSGRVFKVGDTLYFGQPLTFSSGPIIATNGKYHTVFTLKDKNLTNTNFINRQAVIQKVEISDKTRLYVKSRGMKLYVLIDEAIDKGEVLISRVEVVKNEEGLDKYDKLKKLKELLDMGALTQEEFDIEKKKILSE